MGAAERPIYLDHNATTPIHPAVLDAMLPYLCDHFGNPSSAHLYGGEARRAVDRARAQVAAHLGCDPEEIVFTSGGTEANNLAIRGVLQGSATRKHVVTSVVEHPAVARPCDLMESRGFEVTRLPVDSSCRVRVDDARRALRRDTALLTVMLAQNETGTLMPLFELARLAHSVGALVHTDAAQAVGKLATRVRDLGVDLLSIAGHKLYAPKGVGALYVRRGVSIAPVLRGALHERGLRPGTENVASIVALGAACELASSELGAEASRQRALVDELERLIRQGVPGVMVNGHSSEGLPNTLNVAFPGSSGTAILAAAPQIAASTGSACHEGSESPSPVLLAMGLAAPLALGAVRLSIGRSTTMDQVREAAAALCRAFAQRRDPA